MADFLATMGLVVCVVLLFVSLGVLFVGIFVIGLSTFATMAPAFGTGAMLICFGLIGASAATLGADRIISG